MRFPGRRFLHGWDLALQPVSLDDLLRSCQRIGLTGFAEIQLPVETGIVLYYMGSEVSVVVRENGSAYKGQEAMARLRAAIGAGEGTIRIYELPLEMAHLLRGVTHRRRTPFPVRVPADLDALLTHLHKSEHTGLLEVQIPAGAAALLLVNGRVSNVYWEGQAEGTLEGGPALTAVQQGLGGEDAMAYVSDFSREVWKARREMTAPESPEPVLLVNGDGGAREALLGALDEQLPSMLQAFVIDLMTKAVVARRLRGKSALPILQISDRIPALVGEIRAVLAVDGEAPEIINIQSARSVVLVAVVEETQEGVVVIADKAQPTQQVAAVLERLVRDYVARVKSA